MYTYILNGNIVHPRGEWEIEYRRNVGQIFRRRYLTGELTFQDEDYALIMGMADCTVLTLIIYCMGAEFWRGEFKTRYDFKIDEDQCNLKGTPLVVDEYTCIMTNYDTEYNIGISDNLIEGITAISVNFSTGVLVVNSRNIWEIWIDLINGFAPGLGDYMDCNITCLSSFFNEDDFPNGDLYAVWPGAGVNYVTGAAQRLTNVFIAKNSEIRLQMGGTRCDDADNDTITFKFFETLFRDRFNAYWYIDQNGAFRVEHISFFLPGFAASDFGTAGYNLTSILSENGTSYAYRRNKYRYLTDQLYDQETWSWQHYTGIEGGILHNINWQGEPIYYGAALGIKSDCVPGEFKSKDYPTPNIHSDYEWVDAQIVAANVDILGCPGFMILNLVVGVPNWNIWWDNGDLDGVNRPNVHLSTANLMENYHTWNRIFLTGTMNGSDATPVLIFDSAIRKRLQDSITFPFCCDDDFSEFDYMTTHMGLGAPYSLKLNKNSLTTELLYD